MKNIIYTLSISTLLLFLFNSCKKHEDEPWQKCEYLSSNVDTIKMYIQGTWELVEHRRIYRGTPSIIDNPTTLGYSSYINVKGTRITYWTTKLNDMTKSFSYRIGLEKDISQDPYDILPILILYDENTGAKVGITYINACFNTLFFEPLSTAQDISDDETYKRIN